MSYRVEMTDRAYRDLDRLMTWLAERSPSAEDRLYARFHKALSRLESNPFSCGLAFENSEFPEELRHLLFETREGRVYRALFIVRGDVVTILSVRAPGEKPARPEENPNWSSHHFRVLALSAMIEPVRSSTSNPGGMSRKAGRLTQRATDFESRRSTSATSRLRHRAPRASRWIGSMCSE